MAKDSWQDELGRVGQLIRIFNSTDASEDLETGLEAVESASSGSGNVAELVDLLSHRQAFIREEAMRSLVALGEQAWDALLEAASDERLVTGPCLVALRNCCPNVEDAVPVLIRALAHRDESIVGEALEGLAKAASKARAAVPHLQSLIEHGPESLRGAARRTMEQIAPYGDRYQAASSTDSM